MSLDLLEARKTPLFDSSALTDLLWTPRSRKTIDKLVQILQDEPLFKKFDKLVPGHASR